jgi:hypothetical protein
MQIPAFHILVCLQLQFMLPPAVVTDPDPGPRDSVDPTEVYFHWNPGFDNACDLFNAGFESDSFEGWLARTGPGMEAQPLEITPGQSGLLDDSAPVEGRLFLQNGFDGDAGLTYDLSKVIYIPVDAKRATFSWNQRIQWEMGGSLHREYRVILESADGAHFLGDLHQLDIPPNTSGDTGWTRQRMDLLQISPNIAGQMVRVRFHQFIPETFTGPAQFDLDAITLNCTPNATPAKVVFKIYIGTTPDDMNLIGRSTSPNFKLPYDLNPDSRYYWQVVTRVGPRSAHPGKPWPFETTSP